MCFVVLKHYAGWGWIFPTCQHFTILVNEITFCVQFMPVNVQTNECNNYYWKARGNTFQKTATLWSMFMLVCYWLLFFSYNDEYWKLQSSKNLLNRNCYFVQIHSTCPHANAICLEYYSCYSILSYLKGFQGSEVSFLHTQHPISFLVGVAPTHQSVLELSCFVSYTQWHFQWYCRVLRFFSFWDLQCGEPEPPLNTFALFNLYM